MTSEVIVHFGLTDGEHADTPASSIEKSWLPRIQLLDLYARRMNQDNRHVSALLPAILRDRFADQLTNNSLLQVVWYEPDHAPSLSVSTSRSRCWIVNGKFLPFIEWTAAEAATRHHKSDVVVFSVLGTEVTTHYPESIRVTDTDEVLGIQRHYFDSPTNPTESTAEACLLACHQQHLTEITEHLTRHGWNRASMDTLTKRLRVRRAPSPCVVSMLGSAQSGFHLHTMTSHKRLRSRNDRPIHEDNAITNEQASRAIITGRVQTAGHLMDHPKGNRGYLFTKRLIDLTLAITTLVLLSPLLLVVALIVKLTSRGPILFGHKRQGLGGKEFLCWKFRSMQVGSEKLQDELRQQNEVDGPQFKIKCDPRLTAFGDWIRQNNIDELPQLLNVILGQMSLVGPRPSPDEENQLCPPWRRARLSMKPGITGLWQVLRIRDEVQSDFQEWIYYDIEYADHRSTWLDLQLILHTPFTLFFSSLLTRFAKRLNQRGICAHSGRIHQLRKSA